jgi:hypothetical protein
MTCVTFFTSTRSQYSVTGGSSGILKPNPSVSCSFRRFTILLHVNFFAYVYYRFMLICNGQLVQVAHLAHLSCELATDGR